MPTNLNPYHNPSFGFSNRLMRFVWNIVALFLFRPSPRPFHGWRSFLLRCFGATLGKDCHFYPGAKIWAPWNLHCGDHVGVASGAEIYNPATIKLGDYVTISQNAYLCGANHDYNDPSFPLITDTIEIKHHAWIAARAIVLQGVTVGEGAVLAINALATKDLTPWTVYGGVPAREINKRNVVTT